MGCTAVLANIGLLSLSYFQVQPCTSRVGFYLCVCLDRNRDALPRAKTKCDMEEETTVEETTPAPEVETEVPASEEDATKETTSEVEEPQAEETPDFKALFEEEQEARKKAEHKIVKMRAKKLEDDDAPEAEEAFDEKSYVDKKLQEIKYATLETQYEHEIDKLTTNPDEKKLIQLHLETNTFSGSVSDQVQKARALANYKKVARVNKELAHSKSVTPGSENSSSYSQSKSDSQALNTLTEADKAHLKKRGLLEKYIAKHGN